MFAQCADPRSLEGLTWLLCYLTSGTHRMFYASFGTVLLLLVVTAPLALLMGFGGAMAARSRILPLRWLGLVYASAVRGVPDIIFFLFVPLALDQWLESLRSTVYCTDTPASGQVCAAAKLPLSTSAEWVHDLYGVLLAIVAFSFVFGAFATNVLYGAMQAVPRAQLETAEAYGMTQRQIDRRILIPQMWTYALPGLSNLWMILVKATPLLFLLGVEDIVYWARELGGSKTSTYSYAHGDWRVWYFLALLLFYLGMTWISQRVIDRFAARLSRGQATFAGEALRNEVTA